MRFLFPAAGMPALRHLPVMALTQELWKRRHWHSYGQAMGYEDD
jgi:hypothetical protein